MRKSVSVCAVLLMATALSVKAEPPTKQPMLRRLDGSNLSVAEAEAFSKKTIEEHHVTGAQIVVINGGKVVWSAAFGLREREGKLPMCAGLSVT